MLVPSSPYELSGTGVPWKPVPGSAPGTSFSHALPSERGTLPYRMAKWKGEPGVYDRPTGMPWSEVFVVYTGRGRLRFGDSVVELRPGVVAELRKGVPYVFEIDEALEKFAVITLEQAVG